MAYVEAHVGIGGVGAGGVCEEHHAIDGVECAGGIDAAGECEKGEFACLTEADANGGAGFPCEPAAASEPLAVEDEVVVVGAE